MKALYFDLIAGASGDMILGALVDAGVSPARLKSALAGLNLDEFDLEIRKVNKNGFRATKIDVLVAEQPPERHLKEILDVIDSSTLPETIRDRSKAIFQRIAQVEAAIHNTSLDQVHLHELGGTDTIIDVTGVLLALEMLEVTQVFASPVPLGNGFIDGAHGKIPLPAPATLGLLKDAPVHGTDIQAELVTPTGAALLSALVKDYGPAPGLVLEGTGYGAGTRDLPIPNLLRVIYGELLSGETLLSQDLVILESNLDDLNPEIYPFVMEELFQAGALDVTYTPIHMKKNRPGIQVQVLTEPALVGELRKILFRQTTTLGIKHYPVKRFALDRKSETVTTELGDIGVKVSTGPDGEQKISPEYEDCQRLARENQLPIQDIYQQALAAYRSQQEIASR